MKPKEKKTPKSEILKWSVHTPKLFNEIMNNTGCSILARPLSITMSILGEVAQRAIELDDKKLHSLMLRLTLYSCADPTLPDYNPDILSEFRQLEWGEK